MGKVSIKLVKDISKFIAGAGVSAVISNVGLTQITKLDNKLYDKILIGIGTTVIGGMVSVVSDKWVEGAIDEVANMLKINDISDDEEEEDNDE